MTYWGESDYQTNESDIKIPEDGFTDPFIILHGNLYIKRCHTSLPFQRILQSTYLNSNELIGFDAILKISDAVYSSV